MTDLESTRLTVAQAIRHAERSPLTVQQFRVAFMMPAARDNYRMGFEEGWQAAMGSLGGEHTAPRKPPLRLR